MTSRAKATFFAKPLTINVVGLTQVQIWACRVSTHPDVGKHIFPMMPQDLIVESENGAILDFAEEVK